MEDMRVIAGNQAVPMPVRPAFVRPTPAILNQMDAQCLQSRLALRQHGSQYSAVGNIRVLTNQRMAADNQVPAPTAAQQQQAGLYTEEELQQFIAQAQRLAQELDGAVNAQVGAINTETDWLQYAAATEAFTQAETQIRETDDRIYELQQRMQRLLAPEPTAAQQAGILRPSTVQGYHHPTLGFIMTPSILIYYTLRATYEAVYQLAGTLDAESYRRLRQSKGQDLRSWGSKVQAMAASFPRMRDEEHRGIYQEGIIDSSLKARIKSHRAQNPDRGNTLESLIQLAQQLADREVQLLSETVDSAQTSATDKATASRRIGEMLTLMGNGNPGQNLRPDGYDAAAAKELVKSKPSDFRNPTAYRTYCKAPCVLHPKGGHSNEACFRQKGQLGALQQHFNAARPIALCTTGTHSTRGAHSNAVPWSGMGAI
jgi:hypothetical protein